MRNRFIVRLVACFAILGLATGFIVPVDVEVVKTDLPVLPTVEQVVYEEFSATGSASYWVDFYSQADLSGAEKLDWSSRGWYVYEQLKKTADESQAKFLQSLDKSGTPYQSFWIKNTVLVENSSLNTLNAVLNFPDVERVYARKSYFLDNADTSSATTSLGLASIEPNLTHINADDVWSMGIDGAGLVVANIDTGVRYTHQALVNQYRGNNGDGSFTHDYNWYNPDDLKDNAPRDGHGHGTHTMGTILGADGVSNTIGVAPGAEWIACVGCPDGNCTDSALLTCGQWIAAPTNLTGASPNPDMRPNIVNNSWGDCGKNYDAWYAVVIANWHAAGIYPIFSNGNTSNCGYTKPPGLNTVGNPARYGNVTGVGSTGTQNGQYATHSNWGPTDNMDTINQTGFADLKPQVVAPGVDIRSAVSTSDTSFAISTGTSMSAPHVAGLVALIWQAAPCMLGDYAKTENIIEQTATDITYDDESGATPTNFPNFATGWGEIDALAAVKQAQIICSLNIAFYLPLVFR